MTNDYEPQDTWDAERTADIDTEDSTPYPKKRSIPVSPNQRKYYRVKSITEYFEKRSSIFVIKYDVGERTQEYSWVCTEDMSSGYEDAQSDFMDKGRASGLAEAFLNVLWEQIGKCDDRLVIGDVNYVRDELNFDAMAREEFLDENPQYRNGACPPPPDEEFEIVGHPPNSTEKSIMTQPDQEFQTVPDFLKNPKTTGVQGVQGIVNSIFPTRKMLAKAWGMCGWCFEYHDCKVFSPPIMSDDVYNYVSPYEKCWYCRKSNYFKLGEEPIPGFDIDIIHPDVPKLRLRICGVRNFTVQKGVRAKGELQYTDGGIQFRCFSLEVIRPKTYSKPHVSESVGTDYTDIELEARRLAFKKCKERWLKDGSAVPKDDLINEICSERPRLKSLFVLDNGLLELRLAHNTRLKNFLYSLVVPRPDDDGKIEKIGGSSLKFLWQPKKDGTTINITPRGLPDK